MSSVASLAGIKSGKDLNIEKLTSNHRMATDGLKADNFIAVLPTIGDLTGAGTVDSKNVLDFKMLATLTHGATGAAGSAAAGASSAATGALGGLLGQVSGGAAGGGVCSNSGGGMKVPFLIQGTTADPKFIPDVGGLAKDLFKSELGCLGGKSSSTANKNQPAGNNPVDAIGGLFKKKKPQ
jgi:AsmA protein